MTDAAIVAQRVGVLLVRGAVEGFRLTTHFRKVWNQQLVDRI
jgi:hypothetical protein